MFWPPSLQRVSLGWLDCGNTVDKFPSSHLSCKDKVFEIMIFPLKQVKLLTDLSH